MLTLKSALQLSFYYCIILFILLEFLPIDCGQDCLSCSRIGNVTECQQFETCDDNEVCYKHQYRLFSRETEYDLGCGSASVCRGPQYGSVFGKRTDGRHLVCLSCCNETALCNKKVNCIDIKETGVKPFLAEFDDLLITKVDRNYIQGNFTTDKNYDVGNWIVFFVSDDGRQKAYLFNLPRDCSEIDNVTQGVGNIYPTGSLPGVQVYCEVRGNEIWTVIQKRINGCTDFYRNWEFYKLGFGDGSGEYWLGNENIHEITSHGRYKLRVDLGDFENHFAYAEYSIFHVGDEMSKYQISVIGYSGTAGDGLARHNGQKFTTYDRNNDNCQGHTSNCAVQRKGAWWYNCCYDSNLNGLYLAGVYNNSVIDGVAFNYTGINWDKWKGESYSLKSTKMMIRKY